MRALDTNVLIRFLVRDDEKQARIVYGHFKRAELEKNPFFISSLVVLEMIWVLESAYEMTRTEILNAFAALKGMPILTFENDAVLDLLVDQGTRGNSDLSDLLIALAGEASGCEEGLTFDKKASKIPFFKLIT